MSSQGVDVQLLRAAVRDGTSDVVGVAHEVGASAAQMGVPLHEVLDHVERAFAPETSDPAVTRAACLGWADRTLLRLADVSCEDPLTSLATSPYLRSRLAEVYRGADALGRRAGDMSALVVVELPRDTAGAGHGIELSLRALDVAEVLRTVFAGAETLAQLSVRRFVALVARERTDDLTTDLLALLLDRALPGHPGARLWVEHLPSSPDGVAPLLAALAE